MTQELALLDTHHHHQHSSSINSAHSIAIPGGIPPHDLQTCKKCNLPILEGHAYELGDDRWHIHCFKCSKCAKSLGCNSNFLVLGNGNLICSDCSYNCKQCGKKIDDLAILTGDQAYCSNCFKCRSCKNKIEDLRYARTSKGLFCMDCHEKLMAKKKKYDAKKKQLAMVKKLEDDKRAAREREREREPKHLEDLSTINSSGDSIFLNYMSASNSTTNVADTGAADTLFSLTNPSLTSVVSKNKVLPPPPQSSTRTLAPAPTTASAPPIAPYSQMVARESFQSNKTESSITSVTTSQFSADSNARNSTAGAGKLPSIDNDFSIEEVNSYSDGDEEESLLQRNASLRPQKSHSHPLQRKTLSPRSSTQGPQSLQLSLPANQSPKPPSLYSTPPISAEPRQESISTDSRDTQNPSTPGTAENTKLQPAPEITPKTTSEQIQHTPSSESSKFKGNNLMILSPNQFNDHEFHNSNAIRTSPTKSLKSNNSPALAIGIETPNENEISSSSQDLRGNSLSTHLDEPKTRSACPSPFAKANRQARVVETNDFISTENLDEIPRESNTTNSTPKKTPGSVLSAGMSSPPPRLPLPSTPNKKNFKVEEVTPRGLGLEGVEYEQSEEYRRYSGSIHEKKPRREDGNYTPREQHQQNYYNPQSTPTARERVIGNTTPSVTNLEEDAASISDQNTVSSLSRMNTLIRTPKLSSLKHKRSISGGSSNIANKFNFFKSNKDDSSVKGHSRHVSEGSISNGGSAFTTPPLPVSSPAMQNLNGLVNYNREHQRSTSDTPFLTNLDPNNKRTLFDMKSLNNELNHLMSQRQTLSNDVKKLSSEKLKLNDQLKAMHSKLTSESAKYESLVRDMAELEKNKKKLLEINQALSEENHQLQLNRNSGTNTYAEGSTLYSDSNSTLNFGGNSKSTSNGLSLTSSSSLVGTPYNDTSVLEEPSTDPQKATRLKFWRRPKMGFNTANLVLTNSQPLNKISQSYASNAIQLPQQSPKNVGGLTFNNGNANNSEKKGKFIKSKSSNILDTFLTNTVSMVSTNDSSNGDNCPVPLLTSTIQNRADYEHQKVPLIVTKCLAEVEKRGLDMEGIYRISGGNSAIVAIENAFSNLGQNYEDKQMSKLEDTISGDINAVTSALKRYLRKLPDPLIPYAVYDEFIKVSSANPPNKVDKRIHEMKTKVINKLPSANKHTLYLLCKHLSLVSSYSSVNRMGFKNLSVVFAPTIARDETGQREMSDMGYRNDVTELILTHSEAIFSDYSG
ncbi:RhoGAP-domain-containing protein [Suhomyces tanzawaensis NRRL Y-17324]|uniref:RhoGAP-domain-containing protein n=1 Tax=Suhomyces tanzawaensis NRRL Y-17324 TaxID=984487 RepID=A0A1E4SQA5_9ASCO|nr:RhoGAP-domain-containing protein [Suhomyces tanzawaensis NRRL Y-17324]ODV81693.1 RhoGAP-domain-containing protein [Suhomyces tanzawaensis NRRL Y-17324]